MGKLFLEIIKLHGYLKGSQEKGKKKICFKSPYEIFFIKKKKKIAVLF